MSSFTKVYNFIEDYIIQVIDVKVSSVAQWQRPSSRAFQAEGEAAAADRCAAEAGRESCRLRAGNDSLCARLAALERRGDSPRCGHAGCGAAAAVRVPCAPKRGRWQGDGPSRLASSC